MGSFLTGKPSSGKSKSYSESGNYAWPALNQMLTPNVGFTSAGGNLLGSLLGITPASYGAGGTGTGSQTISTGRMVDMRNDGIKGNAKAAIKAGLPTTYMENDNPVSIAMPSAPTNPEDALNNWANSGGINFLREQGIKAIEGSQAGRGMLQSGQTGTELLKFGNGLAQTYLNQYMDNLLKYANLGLGSAGVLANAGNWSKGYSKSSQTGGKQGFLPMLAQGISSAAMSGAGGMA